MTKKIFAFMAALLIGGAAFCQERVGSYSCGIFGNEYEVYAIDKKEGLNVYVTIPGELEKESVMLILNGDAKVEEFIKSMTRLRDKFAEWKSIATENKVKDYSRHLDIDFPVVGIGWYLGGWIFDLYEEIHPFFIVLEDGTSTAGFGGEAVSFDNEFIKKKYYFALKDEKEFDALLKILEPENIRKVLNRQTHVDSLFN